MTDLLTRLEQATEGSRELDARITAVVKGRTFKNYLGQGAYTAEGSPGDFGGNSFDTPHYTTSLDAALTLVPEGYWWGVESQHTGLLSEIRPTATLWRKPNLSDQVMYFGATPALALCIAALRARDAT